MSDSKKLPTSLPSMEHSFQIDIEGDTTKQRYTGDFTCHLLNNKQKARANLKTATLNAGLETLLELEVKALHYMVGYLDQAVDEAPTWWKDSSNGYELYDANVIEAVFNEVHKFEQRWKEQVWGKSEAKAS